MSKLCFCGIIFLGGKIALKRRPDVYKLETELGEEPLLDTLPFISHNTLNIARDLNSQHIDSNNKSSDNSKSNCIKELYPTFFRVMGVYKFVSVSKASHDHCGMGYFLYYGISLFNPNGCIIVEWLLDEYVWLWIIHFIIISSSSSKW